VSTSDLGTKQLCPSCEAKFYDLNKRPAVCPKCQNSFEPDAEEAVAARTKVAAKAAPAKAAKDDDEDEDEAEEVKATTTDDEDEAEEETIAELGDENDPALGVNDSGDDDEDEGGAKGVPAGFSEQGVDDDDILDDDEDETFDIDVDVDVDVDVADDEDDLPGE